MIHICYHGTDASLVADAVDRGIKLMPSRGNHHWLGDGIYFWPDDKDKALEWAKSQRENQLRDNAKYGLPVEIYDPAVLGAEVEVSEDQMLDLCDDEDIELLKKEYEQLIKKYAQANAKPPHNYENYHYIDCQVVNDFCRRMERTKKPNEHIHFVRGLIATVAFPGSSIIVRTDTVIAARNLDCIRKVFRP